jgi:fumarate hydratase class II
LAGVSGSQPVERSLQDRLKVAGVALDLGDRDDHVEHLLEVQTTANLLGTLGCAEQGSTGGKHAAAALIQEWCAVVGSHLQDAVPLTVGQEWSGWATQLRDARHRLETALHAVYELAAGGTAVRTGLNAPPGFGEEIASQLAELTGLPLKTAPNKFAAQGSLDGMVAVSAGLRGMAVALMKIANDMRWLASGPRAGLHELKLPANEPGSSIMPGKVNPTQQEAMVMVCLQVIGEDSIVAAAGAQGNFELNAMRPIIINNVLHSSRILGDMCEKLREFSVEGTELDEAKVSGYVGASLALVTALSPTIGYDKASAISHKADDEGTSLREAALALGVSAADFDRIVVPATMVGDPRRDLGLEHAGSGQR